MTRLAEIFKIRPGEGRMVALLVGLMLCTMIGSSWGSTGIEALFFARVGVQSLPYLYMGLGLITLFTTLTLTAVLGSVSREKLYLALLLIMAALLVGARLLLTVTQNWVYPALWLGKEVLNTLLGLLSWGVAGIVCDTRQAKRLFPLFGAGRILGSVLGGLSTQLLVSVIRTENLLLAWAVMMALAFGLGWRLLSTNRPDRFASQKPVRSRKGRAPNAFAAFLGEMQQGYHYVRRSSLMRWVSVAAILFSILYFSIALPFSKGVTTQFPDEDTLAGFLGLFNGLHTAAAFLASLFIANRLFARFGVVNMVLVFGGIYLVGFGALIAFASFPVLIAFRFAQMVWLAGIADAAYQVLFNAIPSARRDQVRAFIGGVPEQAGTIIAGLILVIGEQALQPGQLYFIGLVAGALTVFVFWRIRRAYGQALVEALRAGQPQLFFSEEQPFGGFRQDAAAVAATVRGLTDSDPIIRRVSAEILGNLSVPEAMPALVNALRDEEAAVRSASLRALASARAAPALLEVAACLRDPEPEVRAQAIIALRTLADYPHGLLTHVRPLLDDSDSLVATHAAVTLLRHGPDAQARDLLRRLSIMGDIGERVNALRALGEWGDAEAFELVCVELEDLAAPGMVRSVAATTLAKIDPVRAIAPLAQTLGDDDDSLREAAALALGQIGAPALPSVVAALSNPAQELGALLALGHLPAAPAPAIRAYAHESVARAEHYHTLTRGFESVGDDERLSLLADALHAKAHAHAYNALRAVGLLRASVRDTMALAIENLKVRDVAQRANALESLEAAGERDIIRPLLHLWEASEAKATNESVESRLANLLREPEAWVRACATLAARPAVYPGLRLALTELAQSDPDALVRVTATAVLNGELAMSADSLPTLSPMERILFLRRVSLFAGLAPAELKRVAAIVSEQTFHDGETLGQQGEAGDEMFIIVSGEVRVLVSKGNTSPDKPDTRSVEVARRKPGEAVGEMAVISREPRMASLVAGGQVRVLCLDQKTFEGLIRERPEISLAVMRVLCARLKEATS